MNIFNNQNYWCFIWILHFSSNFIVHAKADCYGVSDDKAEAMVCYVNQIVTKCAQNFPVGTSLNYRCQKNYFPTTGSANKYRVATCMWWGWSTPEFVSFSCAIDYGRYRIPFSAHLLILGYQADPMTFPWHAALFNTNTHVYFCGGSLVEVNLILTAAHCTFKDGSNGNYPYQTYEIEVILAAVSGIYEDNNNPTVQRRMVAEIIRYNNQGNTYRGRDASQPYWYDIVLLRLASPAQRNGFVRPVRLPTGKIGFSENLVLQVNGFGVSKPWAQPQMAADHFYGTSVIVNSGDCLNNPDITNTLDDDSQFCTAAQTADTGICLGDSGGGAFRKDDDDHWSIVGLVSYGTQPLGTACFSTVIFTKIQTYLPWIKAQTYAIPTPPPTVASNSAITYPPTPAFKYPTTTTTATPQRIPGINMIVNYQANQVALSLHNQYRQRHGSPPMQIDYNLASQAQQYASFIVAQNRGLQPKFGVPYGQNTYSGSPRPSEEAVREAVISWYNGISEYAWQEPQASSYRGLSFSQVVWRSSLRLGVGVATQSDRSIVIAYYSPAGNSVDTQIYKNNVLPPQ